MTERLQELQELIAQSRDGDRFTIHGERILSPIQISRCHHCGMGTCSEAEYHPYLACETFLATHDGREVWRTLRRQARAHREATMSEPTLPSYILAFHPQDRRRKPEIYPFNSEREALRAKREWERDWETDETLVIWRVTAEAVGHDE